MMSLITFAFCPLFFFFPLNSQKYFKKMTAEHGSVIKRWADLHFFGGFWFFLGARSENIWTRVFSSMPPATASLLK